MKIRLLKNHPLGKQNDIIDVPYEKANYLVRMSVAEVDYDISEDGSLILVKEKDEFNPFPEKNEVHTEIPLDKPKRARKRKAD